MDPNNTVDETNEDDNLLALKGAGLPPTTPPVADLIDPTVGSEIPAGTLNSRQYLDVTFADAGSGLNLDSISDADQEFILEGTAASGVTVDGVPTQIGTVFRYHFTGNFGPGPVTAHFLAGSVADHAGNVIADTRRTFTVQPIWIVDDGDSGFSTVGPWIIRSGDGFEDDSRENTRGTGKDTASWSLAVIPGLYRVAATWPTETTPVP